MDLTSVTTPIGGPEVVRPRGFDEETVLSIAIRCFWERGYEGTNIRDLAEVMGMAGASIYNAFGDKRSLFRMSLQQYVKIHYKDRIGRLEQRLPGREAILAFLEETVSESVEDEERKGCLLINSAMEVAPHDSEFFTIVSSALAGVGDFFKRSIESGYSDGSIGERQTASDMSMMLLGMMVGVRVLSRSISDRSLLQGVILPAYALLEPNKA